LILRASKESPKRVVAAKHIQRLALDMKRRNIIDIIERFQTEHALQEEREAKNFHASPNGAVVSGAPDRNGAPQKGFFENEQVRVSIMSVPKGTEWSPPHDGRDRVVVLLDKINQVAETNEKDLFSSSAWRVTWIPANSDVEVSNESDQRKNLMILEFKDAATEQALINSEAPSQKARQ
jgi:hypothetical protein